MTSPLVTIGLPVYNGERFLASTLDSLLGQTLTDIELVISDNASTDSSESICRDYAARDSRVRYIRQPRNLGAPKNWNAVVHHARGRYLKWSSASDHCEPTMLEKCVERLESSSDVVLCTGLTRLVDEHGTTIEVDRHDASIGGSTPSARYAHLRSQLYRNNFQCGVIRLDALRATPLDRHYPTGDVVLTAELSLYGKFVVIPEVLLCRRESPQTFTKMLTALERQRVFDPEATAPMRLIVARRNLDQLASITRAPIGLREKLKAYRTALCFAGRDRTAMWYELRSLRPGSRHTESAG